MISGTIQPRMNYKTVMIPTLEKDSHDLKAAKISLRAAALTVMLRAMTKALSRPPGNQRKREARKEKERLTSVQMPRMMPMPPQWLKVGHGMNRQKIFIRNFGIPMEPIVGIPRTEIIGDNGNFPGNLEVIPISYFLNTKPQNRNTTNANL